MAKAKIEWYCTRCGKLVQVEKYEDEDAQEPYTYEKFTICKECRDRKLRKFRKSK